MTTIRPIKVAGVVVSAGKMMKTVKVRLVKQEWNRHLRKRFTSFNHLLVNDPTSAVIAGDIITMTPERHSKRVMHTVSAILVPFGKPLDERPPLLSEEQRAEVRERRYAEKTARKVENRRARVIGSDRWREQSPDGEVEGQDDGDLVYRESWEGGEEGLGRNEEETTDVGKKAQVRANPEAVTVRIGGVGIA